MNANTCKINANTYKMNANTCKMNANTYKMNANTCKMNANTYKMNEHTCNQPINQATNQPVNQSANQPINTSPNQSPTSKGTAEGLPVTTCTHFYRLPRVFKNTRHDSQKTEHCKCSAELGSE